MLRKLLAVLMALMFALGGTLPVFAQSTTAEKARAGAVYVMTNAPSGNQVIAYQRASDGTLTQLGTFETGGKGSGVGVTVPPDPLGSQDSLLLTPDGSWLFAVNAGSNEVSVFKVVSNGLKLTDKVSSNGSYPVSLTYHAGLLYVLNAGDQGSISGFSLDRGHLNPIDHSTRSLKANTPADGSQPQILESPGQVIFSPDGNFLVVTDKGGVSGTGRLLVFKVVDHGRPSATFKVTTTASPVPFSFVFDASDHLVVVDAGANSISTYALSADGSLDVLDSVTNGQAATCWVAFNGQYIFTDNTGSGTISALRSAEDGSLTLLDATAANTGAGTLPLDMGISSNGKYLYSLETGAGAIGMFHINDDGSLTSLGTMPGFDSVSGVQGIAVY